MLFCSLLKVSKSEQNINYNGNLPVVVFSVNPGKCPFHLFSIANHKKYRNLFFRQMAFPCRFKTPWTTHNLKHWANVKLSRRTIPEWNESKLGLPATWRRWTWKSIKVTGPPPLTQNFPSAGAPRQLDNTPDRHSYFLNSSMLRFSTIPLPHTGWRWAFGNVFSQLEKWIWGVRGMREQLDSSLRAWTLWCSAGALAPSSGAAASPSGGEDLYQKAFRQW